MSRPILVLALALHAGCSCSDPDDEDSGDPGAEEIPYDGIDQDGDGQDLLDVDGDGYAGISAEEYAGEWPSDMPDQLDCDDEEAETHPGSSYEVPYDGVDSDCDAADDYDFDRDGYIPTNNPNTGLPHDPPYTGLLEDGDCDDTDADANPGRLAADDLPYDGIDLNCDCANDFDVDEDGYGPDQAQFGSAFASYEQRYGCDNAALWGDCDDNVATIHPGASDTWYDGVDSDCDGANDYDQDADGYVPDAHASSTSLPAGDCEDLDATIHPGATETFGDAVDQDCSGHVDLGWLMSVGPADWVNPRTPQVVVAHGMLVGVLAAEQWTDRSTVPATTQTWPGLLAVLDPSTGGVSQRSNWNGSATQDPLPEALDAAVDGDGNVYVAFGMERTVGTGTNTYLSVRAFSWNGTSFGSLAPVLQGVASAVGADDVDLQVVGDEIFAASCSSDYMQYAHANWSSGTFARWTVGGDDTRSASACVLDLSAGTGDDQALVHAQGPDSADPKPYVLRDSSGLFVDADPGDTLAGPYEDMELLLVNEDEGLVSLYDGVTGNSFLRGDFGTDTLFVATEVYELSASEDPVTGDVFVAAVTEDRGTDGIADLVILHGQPGALTELEVDLAGATPHGAGIELTESEIALVVATRDPSSDAGDIRWMYVQLP